MGNSKMQITTRFCWTLPQPRFLRQIELAPKLVRRFDKPSIPLATLRNDPSLLASAELIAS